MALIYIIKNKINKKCYVGQTTRKFKYRLQDHRKRNYLIGKAISKCCKKKKNFNTDSGYHWMYYEDFLEKENLRNERN